MDIKEKISNLRTSIWTMADWGDITSSEEEFLNQVIDILDELSQKAVGAGKEKESCCQTSQGQRVPNEDYPW